MKAMKRDLPDLDAPNLAEVRRELWAKIRKLEAQAKEAKKLRRQKVWFDDAQNLWHWRIEAQGQPVAQGSALSFAEAQRQAKAVDFMKQHGKKRRPQ